MWMFPFITGSAVSFSHAKSWSTDHTFRCFALTAGLLSRSADGSPDAPSSRVWQVEPRRYAGRRRSQVNERTPHSCATFPHITSHCQLHACALTPSPPDCYSCQLIPPLLGRGRKSFRVSGLCLQYDSRTFTRFRFQLDSVEDKSDERKWYAKFIP